MSVDKIMRQNAEKKSPKPLPAVHFNHMYAKSLAWSGFQAFMPAQPFTAVTIYFS